MKTGLSIIQLLILLAAAMMAVSCSRSRGEQSILDRMLEFERGGYRGEDVPDERIREIKDAIAQHEEAVDDTIELTSRIGEYYKQLAVEYINREMYGLALESIRNAVNYFPENPLLFYLAGMSAGRMGKAAVNQAEEQNLRFAEAEKYYLRALELDSRFAEALYGLSVLYVFEMDRPLDAEPYLQRLIEKETRNFEAMFLLARVYVHAGRIEEAVELYDWIIEDGQSEEQRRQAEQNKAKLLDGQYSKGGALC